MKKIFLIILLIIVSLSGFSQKHYYSTDDSLIMNRLGIKEQYIFPADYAVYYLNENQDTFNLIAVQWASIIINDEYGYYQLLFFHDFGVVEVYEWEYKRIEWRNDGQVMALVSKDVFGVEVAVLSLWEDEEWSHIALLTSDKKLRDKLLYYTKIKNHQLY